MASRHPAHAVARHPARHPAVDGAGGGPVAPGVIGWDWGFFVDGNFESTQVITVPAGCTAISVTLVNNNRQATDPTITMTVNGSAMTRIAGDVVAYCPNAYEYMIAAPAAGSATFAWGRGSFNTQGDAYWIIRYLAGVSANPLDWTGASVADASGSLNTLSVSAGGAGTGVLVGSVQWRQIQTITERDGIAANTTGIVPVLSFANAIPGPGNNDSAINAGHVYDPITVNSGWTISSTNPERSDRCCASGAFAPLTAQAMAQFTNEFTNEFY